MIFGAKAVEENMDVFIEAAEQLESLKETLSQQRSYTSRLADLTSSVERSADLIAKVPGTLSLALNSAEAVEKRILAAAEKVDGLKNEIPLIVERIERSDVGRSVDALASDIAGSREDLKEFRRAIAQVEGISEFLKASNDAIFKNLSTELQGLKSGQDKTGSEIALLRLELNEKLAAVESNVTKSATTVESVSGATAKAFDSIANALKNSTNNQSEYLKRLQANVDSLRNQELAIVKKDMAELLFQMQKQGAALELLAKKKGFSF
jgi:hypothetical protein